MTRAACRQPGHISVSALCPSKRRAPPLARPRHCCGTRAGHPSLSRLGLTLPHADAVLVRVWEAGVLSPDHRLVRRRRDAEDAAEARHRREHLRVLALHKDELEAVARVCDMVERLRTNPLDVLGKVLDTTKATPVSCASGPQAARAASSCGALGARARGHSCRVLGGVVLESRIGKGSRRGVPRLAGTHSILNWYAGCQGGRDESGFKKRGGPATASNSIVVPRAPWPMCS